MFIVRRAENPSRREASCCIVLVVKGGAGLRRLSFRHHFFHDKPGALRPLHDRGALGLIRELDLFAVDAVKLGLKDRRRSPRLGGLKTQL